MASHTIVVRAIWDDESEVFVATSTDVPGLVAEAANLPELQVKLETLIPELLSLNGDAEEHFAEGTPVVLMSEQVSRLHFPVHG